MHASNDHVFVMVTTPNISVARKVASAALCGHLAACANLIPKIESHYWWQGQIESSSEVLIIFKTRAEKLVDLESCVLRNHPYQTPEFVVVKLEGGNEKYLQWVTDSTQAPPST